MKTRLILIMLLLAISVMAYATDPWGEPVVLTGSMTVMAQVTLNGAPGASGDAVGAFVTVGGNPQLRGKALVQVVGGISGCLLQIYTETNGETISFKVWDESASMAYDATQTLPSQVNGIVGSYPDNMYQITAGSTMITDPWPAPTILTGSMTVMAQVSIQGIPAEVGDILAAFVTVGGNEQLRGKADIMINGGIAGCLMQVYTESNGETITFKVWDYSAQEIIPASQTLASVVNGTVGSWPDNPYQINAGTTVITDPWPAPTILTGSMTVMAQVSINSVPAVVGDILAAFVTVGGNEQLRGKANVLVNSGIAGCLIQVYTESNGETVTFKVWDYSAQEIIPASQTVASVVNGTVGSWPDDLFQINAGAPPQVVATPTFNPVGGTYSTAQSVSISCATTNAQIRYTTNGSDPTESSTLYSIPISLPLNSSTTIKAKAYLTGWTPSDIASQTYIITGTVATPTFSPAAGIYATPQTVVIACTTTGAEIRYTTNNSEPTATSALYSAPIAVNATTTIKAKAFKTGWVPSATATALYEITGTVAMPTFNPVGGTYTTAQSVVISCATTGAVIRYTTNGSDPTATSTIYTTPINVPLNSAMTIKARGYVTGWTPSAIATANYVVTGPVATPEIVPASGTYTTAVEVAISCETAGALIHYTLNGSDPTEASPVYSGVINLPLNSTTTVKARAYLVNWLPSDIATANYVVTGTVATPTFNPSAGTYTTPQTVVISCGTANANIHYTMDGTDPTIASPIYTTPLQIDTSSTIKARAFKTDWIPSGIATAIYTITGTVAAPTFNPPAGTYTSPQSVVLSCTTAGAQIRYTTDGADPTEASTLYTQAINVAANTTIKARAYLATWAPSPIATAVYVITGTVATPVFNPAEGNYQTALQVVITCANPTADIHYTTDGSEPTENSPLYTTPINLPLDSSTTIKARGFQTDWLPSGIATATYVITGTVAMPILDPAPGIYPIPQQISITCTTPGAQIRYTTDGTEPTITSLLYSEPIPLPLNSTTTIKAKAFRTGWIASATVMGIYSITGTVATPVLTPDPGLYTTAQNVSITCATPGAQIRYTTDGTEPTATSTLYSTPVVCPLGTTTTIKAKGFKTDWTPSATAMGVYVITGTVATPTFSPPAGTYTTQQNIAIACATAGAQIRYTMDGSEPTEASALYSAPFLLPFGTTVIKAKGFKTDWLPSATGTVAYICSPPVATPTFTPSGGTYNTAQQVVIACTTPEAQIYYTTDGSEPSQTSTLYTEPIVLDTAATTTIKAKAYKTDWTPSATATALYIINLTTAMPSISPAGGTYTSPVVVTITCPDPLAVIRYTTNGSDPTEASTIYTAPITISVSSTVKARAYHPGWYPSAISSESYTITGTVATPTFNPTPGLYQTPQQVVLACATAGAQIRYTLDDSEPTQTSALYTAPIQLQTDTTTTIKAKAYKTDWIPSATAEGDYVITGTVATPVIAPNGGSYTAPVLVTLTCATPNSLIRYTTNGNDPTPNSTLYTAPFTLSQTAVVKAKAFRQDWLPSTVASASFVISVDTPDDNAIPVVTGLHQVYPNPFSGSTTIEIGVKEANTGYQLSIYNIRGECVNRISGTGKGKQNLVWNGTDSSGRRLAAGVYLLAFKAANVTQTRKVVIR